MINYALYYFTLCSLNCSHYTTISASTGSKHGTCVRCRYTGSFVTQRSMPCTKVMSLLCSFLHPNIAATSPGQSSSHDRRHQAGTLFLFRFRQIPSSEQRLSQSNCRNFLFFLLICSLNYSTLLNSWQTCTNCAPGMDPSACSTQHPKIPNPNVTWDK